MCDVDWFKHYNDHFGHLAGDDALRQVADVIQESVRRGDSVYRYGGEEFVVILAQQSPTKAAAVMNRVRENVERVALPQSPVVPGGNESALRKVVTISVGIAELTDDASPHAWLERADKALYRAKRNGRNRVELDGSSGRSDSYEST
jgi:diguanylate cyclase (GGDEF)-like protein